MPGLIIGGREFAVPGLEILNWNDDPKLRLKLGEDGKRRSKHWVRSIGMHSTKGIPGGSDKRPQVIVPGTGPSSTNAERVAKYWSSDPKSAGAHLVVDHDKTVCCLADLLTEVSYHAGASNESSIGVEVYQGAKAEFYADQFDAVVLLLDAVTWLMTEVFDSSIQRQFQFPYIPYQPMTRMDVKENDFVGVYGHRDQTGNRGPGDPGDWLAERLAAAGWEAFNFRKREDIAAWKVRQTELGIGADGIAGPGTAKALRESNKGRGLWVPRPVDAELQDTVA